MAEKTPPGKKNWFDKHKILTGILGLIVLVMIGSASGNKNDNQNTPSTANNAASSSSSSMPKIGQPASDGKFTFVANKLTCGATTVGSNPYAQATAQGQFCDLSLTIKNTGTESQDLFDANQYLYSAAGNKYSADSSADIEAEPAGTSNTWLNNINPGNSVTGDIYFDVPKGTTPATAELHDSALSGGVKVSLQ